MAESLELRCDCGEFNVAYAPNIDIAMYLRAAAYRGWKLIDPEPHRVSADDDDVDIELRGTCPKCVEKVRAAARRFA